MKIKFANKIFEVLYTKEVAGLTMYAVEDEPNHIDWLVNVEVVNAEKQGEQKSQGKSALEVWKDMRLEVYQQASGNRHEPNYSDDSTKMFSLTDIDEIFEKVAEKQGEQSKKHLYDIIIALWDLLDKIDTFSDLQINDTNSDNPFRKIEHITQERYKFVKSDGYNLYIKGEQITDFKQGEQKPTNNGKPKFKIDDWIVWDNKIPCHVDNIYQGKESLMYTITDTNNMTRSYSVKGFDNNTHLWSIKDAKDGDVLVSKHGNPFIFNGVVRKTTIGAYCGINIRGSFIITPLYNDNYDWTSLSISPATEEQRDLLFSKMKETGYEWDAEKKVLTKLEDEHVPITEWIEDYWKHNKVNNPDSYDGGDEIQFDHDGFVRFCKMYCKKSAWSENDEQILEIIKSVLRANFNPKERFSGYEEYMNADLINWLESLEERYFKPTDEQIIALRWVLTNIPYCRHKEEISGLLDQIKNL